MGDMLVGNAWTVRVRVRWISWNQDEKSSERSCKFQYILSGSDNCSQQLRPKLRQRVTTFNIITGKTRDPKVSVIARMKDFYEPQPADVPAAVIAFCLWRCPAATSSSGADDAEMKRQNLFTLHDMHRTCEGIAARNWARTRDTLDMLQKELGIGCESIMVD